MAVLYLSYDGLLEQLGQSQVFSYLKHLARDHSIILLTFEKADDWRDEPRRRAAAARAAAAGIRWVALRYHKKPQVLSTLYDMARDFLVAAGLALRHRVRLVHARSYVAGAMALALRETLGIPYVFDMRGFWFDARAEMGTWSKSSASFRAAKRLEARMISRAASVVVLSRGAVSALETWAGLQGVPSKCEVITVCTDLELFRPRPPGPRRAGFTLGYVGNAGAGYLFDEVLRSFLLLRRARADARLLVVNRRDHAMIRRRAEELGVPPGSLELASAEHAEVPDRLAGVDAGIFFVRPDPSRVASVPTRMGEFLASGIPCLSCAGAGDVESILEGERVGVVVRAFDDSSLAAGVERLLSLAADAGVRERCVAAARKHFSLEDGVASYRRVYGRLLGAA